MLGLDLSILTKISQILAVEAPLLELPGLVTDSDEKEASIDLIQKDSVSLVTVTCPSSCNVFTVQTVS